MDSVSESIVYNYNELLELFLDFGEALMNSGGEVNRVEDSLGRMMRSYGALDVNVMVITPGIMVTATFPDGTTITQTRRIHTSVKPDFSRFKKLNALSRKCSVKPLSFDDLKKELEIIKNKNISKKRVYLGSIIAAASFSVFFGGSILDGVIGGLFGLLICLLQEYFSPNWPTKAFLYFLTALVAGFGICFAANYISVIHLDKIMIGDIMILVPGVALTNAVRDMLVGDNISGVMRVVESLVWTGALVAGFMIPMIMLGV